MRCFCGRRPERLGAKDRFLRLDRLLFIAHVNGMAQRLWVYPTSSPTPANTMKQLGSLMTVIALVTSAPSGIS